MWNDPRRLFCRGTLRLNSLRFVVLNKSNSFNEVYRVSGGIFECLGIIIWFELNGVIKYEFQ